MEINSRKTAGAKRLVYGSVMATLLLGFAAHAILQIWAGDSEDFGHFYRAAEAMWNGQDIYVAARGHYIYPPCLAFILQPLTLVSERMAASIWAIVNAVLMFTAVLLAAKEAAARWRLAGTETNPSLPWAIAAVATILIAEKMHAIFTLGQTDSLMLLGFACVLRWMDRKPLLSGIAVGAAANIKYLSLIFVPYFLIKRNYRAAISSTVAFVFFLALPGIQVGFNQVAKYTAVALGGLGEILGRPQQGIQILEVTWVRSISITSAAFRLTRSHGLSDPLAGLLVLFVFVALMAALILICRRQDVFIFASQRTNTNWAANPVTSLEWATLIVVALVFSPQTTSRHMVLLSLVHIVALVVFLAQKARRVRTLLILAIALMVAGLSLPLRGIGLDEVLRIWRGIGGASWCAVIFILVLVWAGSRTIAEKFPSFVATNGR